MSAFVHNFEWTFAVPVERVFTALSDATELQQWFAEFVAVELRNGGNFRFWGRHTFGAPTRETATQRLIAYDPPHVLAYTWNLMGQSTTVRFGLDSPEESPATTRVKGSHTFSRLPIVDRATAFVDDLWQLHWSNLYSHLFDAGGLLLPDYSDPSPEVRLAILIDAPRERVFQSLIDPVLMRQWLDDTAYPVVIDVDSRPGGTYSFGWTAMWEGKAVPTGPARIIELVPNERLVTDWIEWHGDPSVPLQRITWLLEAEGSQTRLTLIHDRFGRTVDISSYPFGWWDYLQKLQLFLAGASGIR